MGGNGFAWSCIKIFSGRSSYEISFPTGPVDSFSFAPTSRKEREIWGTPCLQPNLLTPSLNYFSIGCSLGRITF